MQSTEAITFHSNELWNDWMNQLATDDYLVVDNFIPDHLFEKVLHYFQDRLGESKFSKAAIGSDKNRQVESSVRGDFIYWLDRQHDKAIDDLFTLLDEAMTNLRQQLFLSLSDYEFHLALYPPKTHYDKHVDQFHGKANRVISTLIYLNKDWQPGNGGELKIYKSNGNYTLVEPLSKRLVMFKSDTVPHEVLLTHIPRKSITGWMLHKPTSIGRFV